MYTNIPMLNINPSNKLIDYLNGNAHIAIVNPWYELPGINKISMNDFMPIIDINTGYQIKSPKIVYKVNGKFTDKIEFTLDNDESSISTLFKFKREFDKKCFNPYIPVNIYRYNKNTINECIIDYHLCEVVELCIILKILNIDISNIDSIDDEKFIKLISQTFNMLTNSTKINNKIDKYINAIQHVEKINEYLYLSIFDVFSNELSLLYEQLKSSNNYSISFKYL